MGQYSSIQNIWFILAIWSVIYLGDYYFTILTAKLYSENVGKHISLEGSFEITPQFQDDVDQLRLNSPRFLVYWLLSLVVLFLVWKLSNSIALPQLFYFSLGVYILTEGAVYLRHFRNYANHKAYLEGAIVGKVHFTRWYGIRLSAWELFGFGIFFLFLAIVQSSWFFLGGVIGCWIAANKHRVLAKKALRAAQEKQPAEQEEEQTSSET